MPDLDYPMVFECSNCKARTTVERAETLLTSICLVSICLIFSVRSASGQESRGKKSLAGLDGVKVTASADENVKEAGVSSETLKTNTELQLRKADINVYTEEELSNAKGFPTLKQARFSLLA